MPRYNLQTQDLASLANYSQDLKRIAGSLDAYIQALQVDQFAAIEVSNNTIGMRGLEYCSKFVEIMQACLTVQGVRRARGQTRDPGPRRPVSWSTVEATLPQLSEVLQAMIWLQWFTGARSGTVVRAKPSEFTRISEELVAWEPTQHKTQYRGHDLTMYLGPRCQAKVGRYLSCSPYCFDPKGQSKNGRAGRCYSVQSYRQAIQRACRQPRQSWAMPRYRPLRSTRPGRISWPGSSCGSWPFFVFVWPDDDTDI